MYAFEPSEERQMLIDTVKRYAENTLRPVAHDADESAQFPTKIINTGWELGVLQASIPEDYGGFGDHSALTGVLAAERRRAPPGRTARPSLLPAKIPSLRRQNTLLGVYPLVHGLMVQFRSY